MLNNKSINNTRDKIIRIIIFSIIGIICIVSIIIAVVFQIREMEKPPEKHISQEEKQIADFDSIFNNKLNDQGYIAKNVQKRNQNKEIIYTKYDVNEKVNDKYDINVKIPEININNTTISNINKEIEDIFKEKIRNIVKSNSDYEVIYTIEYTAYVNSDILSLVIKANLKEGTNAQRIIVKTYTYNIATNKRIDINEMISIKQLEKAKVQKEINYIVEKNAKQAQSLIELGNRVYKRNLSDKIYLVENADNFFYGPDGALYIIYAYGNNNYTSELDIIPIE